MDIACRTDTSAAFSHDRRAEIIAEPSSDDHEPTGAAATLGDQLRGWCRTNKTSMRCLSLAAGCGEKYIADIVAGKSRNPTPESLRRLAELTGLSLTAPTPSNPRGVTRAGPYMDNVIVAVEASALGAKREIVRDLRLLCREWLKRDPATVPADPYRLRDLMAQSNGATFGVSAKRFANVRSHLHKALQLVDSGPVDRKPILNVGPKWLRLWEAIPDEPLMDKRMGQPKLGRNGLPCQRKLWLAAPLSGLIRFCDRESIEAGDVDAAVLEAYATERDGLSLPGFSAKKRKDLRYAWNKACDIVPGWPQNRIQPPARSLLNLPLNAFPQSFRSDLELYEAEAGCRGSRAIEMGRLLDRARARYRQRRSGRDKPGHAKGRLAETTLSAHLSTLHFAASTLVRNGERSTDEITSIGAIADVATAAVIVDDIENRLGLNTSYAGSVVKMLCSAAMRWRDDLSDEELDDFAALRAEAEGDLEKGQMSDRDRARLAPFMNPDMMQRLVLLPLDIVDECEIVRRRGGPVTRRLALAMQSAVICLLEQTLVPRLGTLARTHLDRHIIWPQRKGEPGYLTYGAVDTKTRKPLVGQLAPWKMAVIELYVAHYRSLLANGPKDRWMFPGDKPSRGKSRGALASQSRELLFDKLGVRINFHLWRKIMASWLLQETRDPNLVGGLLGHVDGSRVTLLYAEFQSAWSAAALDATVERLLDRRLAQVGLQSGRRLKA